MYREYNPNPKNKRVGDCTVRAISKALGQSWYKTYVDLAIFGFLHCDMPSSNNVWAAYLKSKGYKRLLIPDDGIEEYSMGDFCRDHPNGVFIVGTGSHVVCIENGIIFDAWDSTSETPEYYFEKRE